MHALRILRDLFSDATPQMHATRREAVLALVSSALAGSNLAVTPLGRGIKGNAYEKHRI